MNNKVIIAVVLVVLLGAGGFFFVTQQKNDMQQAMTQDETAMAEDTSMSDEKKVTDENMMEDGDTAGDTMTDSRYVEYTKAAFDQAGDKKRVLFFYASWCPTCRPADAEFQAKKDEIPDDIAVFRVNYNDPETDEGEKALAKKYGITYQHTYVLVDEDGNEIKKWNGGQLIELLTNAT